MEKYIKWLSINNYSKNTIRTYSSILSKYSEKFHDVRLIKKKIISYVDSPNTCILHYNVVLQFLRWSNDKRADEINKIKLPSIPMIYREVFSKSYLYKKTNIDISDEDLQINKKMVIRFLYETGIRASELCNIIEMHNDFIVIKGKGNKTRSVFYKKNTFALIKNTNITTKTLRLWVKEILGEKYSPHSIRRSFATNMLLKGASPKMVQIQLGHSKIETTFSYLNLSKADNVKIYNKYL